MSRKKAKKKAAKTVAKKPAEKQSATVIREKSSIIVLSIAAAIFLAALFFIYSGDILHGAGDIFTSKTDEMIEYERATVVKITNEDKKADEVETDAFKGEQDLQVIIKTGRYKNETMEANNYFGPLYGVPVEENDSVILAVKTHPDGTRSANVYEYNRIPALFCLLLVFFAVIIIVGRLTGLKSLIGLIFTVICLFAILIPLLLKGAPTILTTFITCAFIALVCFTILGGVHRKSISAFLGTVSGAFLAMVLGVAVQHIAKIDGLRLDDAEALLQMKAYGLTMGVKGLLVAGIIISALGAVMDIAMSISSALEEIHSANPSLKRNELFKSGMNIGRDMAGTMTNTLILAFLGSEFTLTIFLYARGLTFYHLYGSAFVSIETISGLASSIGMIMAIPLTALISSALISREK